MARAAADAPRAPPEAEHSYAEAEAVAATEAAAQATCKEALSAAAAVREQLHALAVVASRQALLYLPWLYLLCFTY